jgi:tRNA A-37 threonylcarbamoyl transferase component Bud32
VAQSFPTKLGRYQIVKHLANGGMAQVLLARATGIEGFERHVVVKRIHQNRAEDPVFVKMFLDEARLAAQLHHNNIVQVHDIGKEKGEYFFAMEYVHGEDLRKLLMKLNKKQDKVPFEHVVTIVTTVALALHHAHEQRGADRKPLGLVHRDVSPANIIVGYDGNVKVVDFGIAKAALRTTREDTKAGSLKGKVSYMSPEQCAGLPVDRRGDVYSLGIVLFELSTVRRLFKGNNDFLTMSSIVQGNIPKPSSYRPDLPTELEGIILKALSLDPGDRYQSADEMREALEAFAATKGLRTSTGALAGYMKQVFGQRPEPWLVDNASIELELTVDFDGEETGAAAVPDPAEALAVPSLVEPTPSSPILRARKKVATDANALIRASAVAGAASKPPRPQLPPPSIGRKTPVPVPLATPPLPFAAIKPAKVDATQAAELPQAKEALAKLQLETPAPDDEENTATPDVRIEPIVPKPPVLPVALEKDKPPPKDDGWTNGSPTTGSGTPLAWTADVTATTALSPKKKLFAIGGVVLLGFAAAAFLVMRGGDGEDSSTSLTPAKSVSPPPQIVEPPPPQPPPPPPVPVDAAELTQLPGSGSGSNVDVSPVTVGSGSAEVKKPVKRPVIKKPKEQWNPDELFLPEQKK